MESDEENMVHAENGDDLLSKDIEGEKGLVRELLKFNIYGDATTLDEIVKVAKKIAKETKARVEKLKTLFKNEQNRSKNYNIS